MASQASVYEEHPMAFKPSLTAIERLFPRAKPEWLSELSRLSQTLCPHYKFDRLEWVHFIGQIGHETNGLSLGSMRENMSFTTPARIKEVYAYRIRLCLEMLDKGKVEQPEWAKGLTVDQMCRQLTKRPEELARIVYGGREGTPWYEGHRYIGRGPTQITHRDNYKAISDEIARQPGGSSVDLVSNPELLEQPEWGVRSAFADWYLKKLRQYAWVDDVDRVSAKLNTGSASKVSITNGIESRRRWVAKAKGIWPAASERQVETARILKQGDRGPEVESLQRRLVELGYPVGRIDGVFGLLTTRAVRSFQAEHELVIDGKVGPRTSEVMASTAPPDLGARANVTAKELAQSGSVTVNEGAAIEKDSKVLAAAAGVGGVVSVGKQVADIASEARSLSDQMSDLVAWIMTPAGIASVAILVSALIFWRMSTRAKRIVMARVEDARKGLHLGR